MLFLQEAVKVKVAPSEWRAFVVLTYIGTRYKGKTAGVYTWL